MSFCCSSTDTHYDTVMRRAHAILSHPMKKAQYLYRTELCKYGAECPHGVRCERAHSTADIRHVDCLYEDYCFKTSPSHAGESCYFYHPKDGDRQAWLTRVSQTHFRETACRLCPHRMMTRGGECRQRGCGFAHSLSTLMFPGRCPRHRQACRSDCLARHRAESREQYVESVEGVPVEEWMWDNVSHHDEEDEEEDDEVKSIMEEHKDSSFFLSSRPSLPSACSPGSVSLTNPIDLPLSELRELRDRYQMELARVELAIQQKLSVLCISPGAPVR